MRFPRLEARHLSTFWVGDRARAFAEDVDHPHSKVTPAHCADIVVFIKLAVGAGHATHMHVCTIFSP